MKNYTASLLRFTAFTLVSVLFATMVQAQKCAYSGEKITLKDFSVQCELVSTLEKPFNKSIQGMDLWGNTVIGLQHTGLATIYEYNGRKLTRKGQFKLASFNEDKRLANHANVASFSRQFVDAQDKLPLLYVTRCNAASLNGMDQLLFVERINPDKMTSELVQTITFQNRKNPRPHTTQWVLDNEHQYLYGFGNSQEKPNRHFVVKFALPEYRGPQDSLVVLTEEDVLESYFMEDTYKPKDFQPIIQGACIHNNLLYLPMGVGTSKHPSILYVWNLETHTMQNEINLQEAIPFEMEDCAIYHGTMLIHADRRMFRLNFDE